MINQLAARIQFVAQYRGPRKGAGHAKALEYLAGQANQQGWTSPIEHKRLGLIIGRHKRTVQDEMHDLARAGLVLIQAVNGYANRYRVLFDWVVRLIQKDSEREQPTPNELAALETEPAPVFDSMAVLSRYPNLDHHPRL